VRFFRLAAIVLGHLALAAASYWVWALGKKFAPEILMSEVVIYPMIMGVVGIWIWFGFWSAKVLRGPASPKPGDEVMK
jgi:hypothetical protein